MKATTQMACNQAYGHNVWCTRQACYGSVVLCKVHHSLCAWVMLLLVASCTLATKVDSRGPQDIVTEPNQHASYGSSGTAATLKTTTEKPMEDDHLSWDPTAEGMDLASAQSQVQQRKDEMQGMQQESQAVTVAAVGCAAESLPPTTVSTIWPSSQCNGSRPGASCTASCATGFKPYRLGPPTVKCLWSLNWTIVQGSCILADKFLTVGTRRWLLNYDSYTLPEANTYCQKSNGTLVTINNSDDARLMAEYLGNVTSIWIGLVGKNSVPSTQAADYLWLSTGLPANYSQWAPGQPDGKFACVQLRKLATSSQWRTNSCIFRQPFVCQIGCAQARLPAAPANSSWPRGMCDGALPGASCNATCQFPGPDSPPAVTCTANGSWSNIQGSCGDPVCIQNPPMNPPRGSFNCGALSSAGQTCNATCDDKYSGSPQSTCQADGTWSRILGRCTMKACTDKPRDPPNGKFNCGPARVGRSCRATCNSGFSPSAAGPPTVVCRASGKWSFTATGACGPAVNCPGEPIYGGPGMFRCSSRTAGFVCTGTCNIGYAGTLQSTCQKNTIWSPVTGSCRQVACVGSPNNPLNGRFSCTEVTPVGQSCTASCNAGFAGAPTATCQDDFRWGSVTGACT